MDEYSAYKWPENLKKTKQRLEVLKALCESDRPVSAQELFSDMQQRGTRVWLSTIYRVLETLVSYGVIQKAAVRESGISVYELGDAHRHYAVCKGCDSVIAIRGCPLEGFMPDLNGKDFHVLEHKLQIYGYCGDCYRKLK